jgi:PAS domain-containing protein
LPEEGEKMMAMIRTAIREGVHQSGDLVARGPGDTCALNHIIVIPETDSQGRVVRLCGTVQDISDRPNVLSKHLNDQEQPNG